MSDSEMAKKRALEEMIKRAMINAFMEGWSAAQKGVTDFIDDDSSGQPQEETVLGAVREVFSEFIDMDAFAEAGKCAPKQGERGWRPAPEELAEIARLHDLWRREKDGGKRADLSWADLHGADLSGLNLSSARFYGAKLYGASLQCADLSGARLCRADLYGSDLQGADLSGADLSAADLRCADVHYANLDGADLRAANLRAANLDGANLDGADLTAANLENAKMPDEKGEA